jgi:uncharacterized protein (DUF433 family)
MGRWLRYGSRMLPIDSVAGSSGHWGLSSLHMAPSDRILLDPAVHHGKPVIRGTRIPVTTVVGSLAGGMTFEEIQREYDLTADDIRAALRFVTDLADQESFHPLPAA